MTFKRLDGRLVVITRQIVKSWVRIVHDPGPGGADEFFTVLGVDIAQLTPAVRVFVYEPVKEAVGVFHA